VTSAIRVISLPHSPRRAQFAAAAGDTELPWAFFDGYTALTAPLQYDAAVAARRFGRPLSPGEIGCYTSHYKLWEAFLASDARQIIVMEEDVIADWAAIARLARHDFSGDGIDILRLFSTHPFPFDLSVQRFLSPHAHLLRVRGLFLGTQAYLLTRKGAEALMRLGHCVAMPVDWAMSRYWSYGAANYCLFPFPVLERYGISGIGHGGRGEIFPLSAGDRLARLLHRLKDRAKRAYVNRIRFPRHPFGPTAAVGKPYIERDT
jgi:glycosyl transferase, family 25